MILELEILERSICENNIRKEQLLKEADRLDGLGLDTGEQSSQLQCRHACRQQSFELLLLLLLLGLPQFSHSKTRQ